MAIDFEQIQQRIVALPEPAGDYSNLQAGQAGQVFYLDGAPHGAALKRFDLGKRKTETILSGVGDYRLSAAGKKALVFSPPESWSIAEVDGPPPAPGKGTLNIAAVEVRIDPRAEWRQIFDEAWRINRDNFYDPGMHGADWPAMRKKYAAFLPHLATRSDLFRVMRWMLSEMAVGHSYLFPAEPLEPAEDGPRRAARGRL